MKTGSASFLAAGLLALAGISFDARPASAQTQFDCPLPPGVTAPPDPSVTAQQVENGSASLRDFALEAKRHLSRPTSGQTEASYVGCVLRQEGSPWRSDPTYLVILSPDGRVLAHMKNMALSGRLLKRAIYEAILEASGTSLADVTHPATAQTALNNASAGDGGRFDVPEIPGASGYATAYRPRGIGTPNVLLAGYDLDRSHLVDEAIDHLQPAVTAKDVVDRPSLKAFVTDAGDYLIRLRESGDRAATSKARIAFRDPNGPWRHGSVYLYVLDLTSNIVLLHATQPDLLELRPLVGIARDGVTGELILPRVLEAAQSDPEGGFVAYYYDDPADDTDSDDIPKVGYAREFTGTLQRPDGSVLPIGFIVGSGFYRDIPEGLAAHLREGLAEGERSLLFGITTPADADSVAGNAVTLSATGAPTDEVHFAFRPADDPDAGFAYLDAAANQDAARLPWDTLPLPDGDYELAALFTEDAGDSITFDIIEVSVDNLTERPDILENDGLKIQALRMGELHEVVTADGVMVTVPVGALASDDRLTITVTEPPEAATAPGDAVGVGVDISLAGGGATFAEAVTVALPYPDGESDGLVDDTSVSETGLSLWYFDGAADAWERISGSRVQSDTNLVVADVRRPGEYGIFDAPPPAPPGGGGGGCAALPVLPGGSSDPTLPGLVALVTLYLLFGRRPRRQVALG